jgi:Na+-transporting methylmalonyl-CoA/oxaloacetate decarboxylase gamma subunit
MSLLWTIVALGFVVAVLSLVAFALFEMSPFGRHEDHYRDPRTGRRTAEAPNLEDGHY